MALHAEQVVRGLDALRSLVAHALADPFAGAAGPTPALAGGAPLPHDTTARRTRAPASAPTAAGTATPTSPRRRRTTRPTVSG